MPTTSAAPPVPSLKEQLVRESCSMARHLATNGIRVPPGLIQATDQFEIALAQNQPIQMTALASTHERLARLLAPAKPGTLLLLDESYQQAGQTSLGPVKLVRDLVKVAMVCVGIFIVLSVIELVDAHRSVDLWGIEGTEPADTAKDNHTFLIIKIILQRVFWLAAAGIGASFAMLFQLNDQIVNRTFDPDENAAYWVKFFLGLVAGFILVALVPIGSGDADPANTGMQALGPPTIALLGGFSASAVYRILTRMVEALESIFSGGAKEQAVAAEKAASARANEESMQGRLAVAGQLVELQQKLAAGMPSQEAARYLKQVVGVLVPSALDTDRRAEDSTATAPPEAGKVPALVVVSAPEAVVAQTDAPDSADESGSAAPRAEESAAAVG
ncbi:MAG TPA: hypothetical protein VEQ60_08450 [Longimicrobium sp.]|nr:hypothetical protein [Longimicrobium sp.]